MIIDNRVTGSTKIIGLIGNPVKHTISPQLHNTISKKLGLDIIYLPFKVDQDKLEDAVKGLRAINVIGFNVTMPYKREIMKYIDDNIRETFLMGAINTVKNINGRFYGYNTDGEGFMRAFKQETNADFKNKKVTLIGAGGVARSIAVKIAQEGASKINIMNRTTEKASEIAEIVNGNIKEIVQVYNNQKDKSFNLAFSESEIIINTTSVGMHPDENKSPICDDYFVKGQIVYDVIYNPKKTNLLINAENKGCITANGLSMLFYQGIYAYEILTGVKISEGILNELSEVFLTMT